MIDFDGDVAVTRNVLDALDTRARVVMHNIANQNTPGYKAYRVKFEELLRDAHRSGAEAGDVVRQVVRDQSGPPGANNVSVIDELATLDKVRILNDLFTRRARGYFTHLNKAIRGHG